MVGIHTCDDGDLVLERAPELCRVDEGVDVGAEAGGELGWGWLLLGHFRGCVGDKLTVM